MGSSACSAPSARSHFSIAITEAQKLKRKKKNKPIFSSQSIDWRAQCIKMYFFYLTVQKPSHPFSFQIIKLLEEEILQYVMPFNFKKTHASSLLLVERLYTDKTIRKAQCNIGHIFPKGWISRGRFEGKKNCTVFLRKGIWSILSQIPQKYNYTLNNRGKKPSQEEKSLFSAHTILAPN